MRYHGLDLNLLVLLDTLRIERNVTRGAVRLNLTQSAVSAALGRLRDHFGDPLFTSVAGRMMPTPLMDAIAPHLDEFLAISRTLAFAGARFEPAGAERHFYVMASDYVLAVVMPQVQRRLQAVAPGIRLGLHTLPLYSGQVERLMADALERHSTDFVILPATHQLRAHPHAPLFQDDFTTIAWTGNTRVGKTLSLPQYLELEHVVRQASPDFPGSMEAEFFQQAGYDRRVAMTVDQFSLIPEFIVGSERIATLHTRLARLYGQRFPLRLLKPPLQPPPTVQVIQWHAHRDADPALAWFRRFVQDAIAGL